MRTQASAGCAKPIACDQLSACLGVCVPMRPPSTSHLGPELLLVPSSPEATRGGFAVGSKAEPRHNKVFWFSCTYRKVPQKCFLEGLGNSAVNRYRKYVIIIPLFSLKR